jgi:hypothetical protein
MISKISKLIILVVTAYLPTSTLRAKEIWPVLQEHCIQCHGQGGKVKGKLNLLEYGSVEKLAKNATDLERILEAIEFEEMPPEEENKLAVDQRKQLVAALKTLLQTRIAEESEVIPTPIRRMNRFQYNNAVKDLLDLKVEVYPLPEKMLRDRSGYFRPESGVMPAKMTVSSRPLGKSGLIEPRLAGVTPFPQDLRAEHGFDNRGDHLSLSPALMEAFLGLSHSITGSTNFGPETCGKWAMYFKEPVSEGEQETKQRVKTLLTNAFRRPVDAETIDRYAGKVRFLQNSGVQYTDAMKQIVSAVLASPRFLYLYNIQDPNYAMASKLSFFLWGSIPDQELLEAAATGKLTTKSGISQQVERMLKDHKLKRFCDSFPSQWLQLDRILSSVPDVETFRDFYYAAPNYRTSMDMMLEPLLLFETILIENRSILELVDSDFSYRSPRLERWYGKEVKEKPGGPVTIPFKRVTIDDRRQGGVITSAAILTMNSGPTESKPITRGAWIASAIFNNPPKPPPADVPPLPKPSKEELEKLTLRERFAEHRKSTECAGCHAKLDPLGFAMENYDPVGRWRDAYENGLKVDASGTLFRKHKFSNPIEFKDAILAEKDRFARGFAEHLLSFAICRELEPSDTPAIDRILGQLSVDGYRLKSVIHLVTESTPFVGTELKN